MADSVVADREADRHKVRDRLTDMHAVSPLDIEGHGDWVTWIRCLSSGRSFKDA